MNRATVNCARLVHFDEESCGSIVHTVDKVLEPPTQTVVEMLEANPQYSMFYKFLQQANLTETISGADDSFTIFVPKDDVFLEVAEWYKDMLTEKNEQQLSELMQTHIVPDVLCCAGIARTEWPFLRTVETVNKKTLRLNRDRRPLVQNAGITKCDQIGKNGIIHEINDIIEFNRKPSQGQHNQGNQNIYSNLFGQLGGNFNAFPF